MKHRIIFVVLAFITDMLLSAIIPMDYAARSMLFISNAGLCAMVMTTRSLSLLEGLIFSFLTGLIWGFFVPQTVLLYPVLFTIIVLVTRFWSFNMTESFFELFILCLVTIFLKEFMLYLFMSANELSRLSLSGWLRINLFVTIFGNIPLVAAVITANRRVNQLVAMQDEKRRKGEHIFWI